MFTVFQSGPYDFIFFSSDRGEPVRVHVKRDRQIAEFWLSPIRVDKDRGFRGHEINKIIGIVEENQEILVEAWHDYFDT